MNFCHEMSDKGVLWLRWETVMSLVKKNLGWNLYASGVKLVYISESGDNLVPKFLKQIWRQLSTEFSTVKGNMNLLKKKWTTVADSPMDSFWGVLVTAIANLLVGMSEWTCIWISPLGLQFHRIFEKRKN